MDELQRLVQKYRSDIQFNGLKKSNVAHKVLIVDDAVYIRKTFRRILEGAGYNVVGEAEDGLDAIEQFRKLEPDLVTMDITMPKMEGIESLEHILKIDSSAKVVMVTAMGYQTLVRDAILKGAKNFIVKPVLPENIEKFLGTLKKVVGEG
jgi:two-component system chemotaxis response regulator CheY